MRITLFVGETVVATVRAHPEQNRAFEGHRAGDHQHTFEERGCLERLVREVAMESDTDAEHLDRIEHREEGVVERAQPAGEHQVHGDREPGGRYPDGDRSDDAFGARALRVQLHDRPSQRLFPGYGSSCCRPSFELHAFSPCVSLEELRYRTLRDQSDVVEQTDEVSDRIQLPPVSAGLSKTGPSVMVVVP